MSTSLWLYQCPAPRSQAGLTCWQAVAGEAIRAYGQPGAALLDVGPRPAAVQVLLRLAGASAGQPATWHYVVEAEVAPDHEDEFNAWYDTEHLPGLAAVPGTVQALRLCGAADGGEGGGESGGRRYHACYDLAWPETLGSAPWLAVRGTPWSTRVRGFFLRVSRTLYRRPEPT